MPIHSDKRPADYELALMSQHVYQGRELSEGDSLPTDSDWVIKRVIAEPPGFFAVIYINSIQNQVVVAYRGTDSMAALVEDIQGIFLSHPNTPQKQAAFETAEQAKRFALRRKSQLTFTGHSLGAYLAELSVFYIQVHLTEGLINNDYDIRHYVSAVTFESPGTQDIMIQLQSQLPHERRDLSALDITEYVSYPNLINTCNQHVGTLYSLEPNIKDPTWFATLTGEALRSIHSIDNIVELFKRATNNRVSRTYMSHWPQGTQRKYFFEHVSFNREKQQYVWTTTCQMLVDRFTLIMDGHYQCDTELSNWRVLLLRHFSLPIQEWLIDFYAQLRYCDQQQLIAVRQAWLANGIESQILAYLVSSQLLKRGIGQSTAYVRIIEQDNSPIAFTVDQFREILSEWLSNKRTSPQAVKLMQVLSEVLRPVNRVTGSVEAVLLESGATLTKTGRIDDAKVSALVVDIPLDTNEANILQFQQITRQFMDDIAQSGLRVRAVGIERGARMEGTIGKLEVAAVRFGVGTSTAAAVEVQSGSASLINLQRKRDRLTSEKLLFDDKMSKKIKRTPK